MFNNLPRAQRKASHDVKSYESAVVKAADKGGSVVVMDIQYYDQEMYRQLQNPSFYTKLKGDLRIIYKKRNK